MLTAALFGLGRVAERIHLPAIKAARDLTLVASCDPDETRRHDVQRKFALDGVCRCGVAVCGLPSGYRDHWHPARLAPRSVSLALRNGSHVFCEKPFVQSVQEADEVIRRRDAAARLVASQQSIPAHEDVRGHEGAAVTR